MGPEVCAAHDRAVVSEQSGLWHDALRWHTETQRLAERELGPPPLTPWRRSAAWTQMLADERRCMAATYGPRGGDATISTWRRQPLVAGTPQPPKTQFNTFVNHLGVVYRYGGCYFISTNVKKKDQPDDSFWAFDPAAHAWRQLDVPPGGGGGGGGGGGAGANGATPGKRSGHVAVVHGGYMWVWGGSRGNRATDGGLYRVELPSRPGTGGLVGRCELELGLTHRELERRTVSNS